MSRRSEDGTGGHDPHEPVSITSVPEPRGDEQARRWHVYVIQMTVRIGCFVAALFTHGPLQIVLIVGAVVLPYTAVIFANASGERRSTEPATVELPGLPATPDVAAPRVIDRPIEQPAEPPVEPAAQPAEPPADRPDEPPTDADDADDAGTPHGRSAA